MDFAYVSEQKLPLESARKLMQRLVAPNAGSDVGALRTRARRAHTAEADLDTLPSQPTGKK